MKYFILLYILAISCNTNETPVNKSDKGTNVVLVDTISNISQSTIETKVKVDSAKNYSHEPTEAEIRRQKKAYEEIFGPEFYKIGAKSSDVIKVEGQPNSVIVSGPYKTFYYGRNSVTFYNRRLQDYNNFDGKLKIKID